MTIETWLAFVAASTILLLIPGPTILTVISHSVAHGKHAVMPLVLAVALGDSTALFFSLAGLGAVLANSAFWFTLIKWLGGVYLLYLGIKLLKSRPSLPQRSASAVPKSRWTLFGNTWLITTLNPKGIVFFVAFLPQFLNPAESVSSQLWVLSVTFVVLATLNASLYAIFAGAARQVLSSPVAQKRFNLTGGSLLCTAGIWALTARHQNV